MLIRAGGLAAAAARALPKGVGLGLRSRNATRMVVRASALSLEARGRLSLGESGAALAIGAHRGCGENVLWHASSPVLLPPVYRENTIRSFMAALADGASFLEFDVQVTADGVPVIWHDNYVVYGEHHNPVSKLISELTLAEFRALAPINQVEDEPLLGTSPTPSEAGDTASEVASLYGTSPPSSTASSRLLRQHRNGIPAMPHEPSLRAWEVAEEDHLPTLGEVFAALPIEVPLDIEIKMATPDDLAITPAAEISRMLDSILTEVDAAAAEHGQRPLIFSSFDPDICTELKARRPAFRVFFLTGGGEYSHADPRRTSLPAAIDFASQHGLEGVIVNTAAIAKQQHLVAEAHARGLQVLSYGTANNDPGWVRQQAALGLQAVIVDDVAGVVSALTAAPVLMPGSPAAPKADTLA